MRVSGPVTGGSKGWAFGGPVADLAALGYRQEEYFLEGEAARYGPVPGTDLGRDGRWQVEPVETTPLRRACVVVRPDDPAAFNGTVIVLWNNVSAGYENFGGGDSPEVFENGYAYVAVSAQRVGIHGQPDNPQGLQAWDPERYGSLSIPSDDYSFDIFTQAANLVAPDRPRGDARPDGRPRRPATDRPGRLPVGGPVGLVPQRCPTDHRTLRRLLPPDVLRRGHAARGGGRGDDRPGGRPRRHRPGSPKGCTSSATTSGSP